MRLSPLLLLLALAACRNNDDTLGGKQGADSTAVAAPVDSSAQPDTLPPVAAASTIQQAQRGTFEAFIAAFRAAVARRDAASVRAVLSPSVTSSFGGNGGPEEFLEQYPLNDPNSQAWADLDALLAGPPGQNDSIRVFPAEFALEPPENAQGDFQVVTMREAVLRDAKGQEIERVPKGQWMPLCPEGLVDNEDAYCVVHPDAGEAWVSTSEVYAPFGLRMGFRRDDGRWQLLFLVAGD